MTEGWRGGGPGDLRTPTLDPISLARGLCQPLSTGVPRLRSCNDQSYLALPSRDKMKLENPALNDQLWEIEVIECF
eukprot:1116555-Pleurochrysis_carterae.AAC.1